MILIDANLLLYAYDEASAQHRRARAWVEEVFSSGEPVRLAWSTILAFLRLTTHSAVFKRPLSMDEAVQVVDEWLDAPPVAIVVPGSSYWTILRELATSAQVKGPLVMDAHLAALAIENGATLCTTDRDFQRFDGLRTLNPL
ncbi:MAG TPA: TA system VapC family ribonuclease toxin [Thermoanaerobaculia bacterium]|nr:TA system VapC family ribonuclease toxin [Thermoanaerobaculia bacterium]